MLLRDMGHPPLPDDQLDLEVVGRKASFPQKCVLRISHPITDLCLICNKVGYMEMSQSLNPALHTQAVITIVEVAWQVFSKTTQDEPVQ